MPQADRTVQQETLAQLVARLNEEESQLKLGGGKEAIERQHAKKRLTARERIERLIDPGTPLLRARPVGRLADV